MLRRMKKIWPQYDIDGMRNIWILKPGDKSKGVGKCSTLQNLKQINTQQVDCKIASNVHCYIEHFVVYLQALSSAVILAFLTNTQQMVQLLPTMSCKNILVRYEKRFKTKQMLVVF